VLDEQGDFDYLCNMEMVELSLVEELSDARELKEMIGKHHQYTNSDQAGRILAEWDRYLEKFIKVTPIEYKKVLQERKIAELEKKIAVVERDY
jgi:glutamate synthase (NADPH/NADH) large chain